MSYERRPEPPRLLAVVDRVNAPRLGTPLVWMAQIRERVGPLTERDLDGPEDRSEHATKRAAINWAYDALRKRGVPLAHITIRVIPVGV